MGILDEAIKEHLELKRQHGAGESELKQLEDEAFGAAVRQGAAEAAPEEESPAAEHEISTGPTAEEREAIAEQPTEMFDVEGELAAQQAPAPSEEELVEEEMEEPRLAPVDPLAGLEEPGEEVEAKAAEPEVAEPEVAEPDVTAEDEEDEDEDFWDEKRLSDELDQALEAPSETGDEEAEVEIAEQPAGSEEEDVLEETPDFLEETPEDDQLWFEQKPPKDFDFDD